MYIYTHTQSYIIFISIDYFEKNHQTQIQYLFIFENLPTINISLNDNVNLSIDVWLKIHFIKYLINPMKKDDQK